MKKLLILCMLLLSASPMQVVSTVPVTFFVSDQFANAEYLDDVLPYYVAHMNVVLQKNTDVVLEYAGYQVMVEDVEPQVTTPFNPPLAIYDFPFWIVIHKSTDGYDHYLGMAINVTPEPEATVLKMSTPELYNPLNPSSVYGYVNQLMLMLHEFGHEFGAGIGEYYKVANVPDMTGVAPLQAININNPTDEFWSDKQDFLSDPMYFMPHLATVQASLDATQFSALSAEMFALGRNTGTRPYLDGFTVRYLGVTGQPLANGRVRVWQPHVPNYSATLISDTYTPASGEVYIAWDGTARSNSGMLRTIKFHKPGYVDVLNWSIFDSDIKKYVQGLNEDVIVVHPATYQTFSDVPVSHAKWQAVESISAAGITSGCLTNPLRFCPDSPVTRSQIAVFLLRARYGASYVPPAPVGIFADVSVNYWAAGWIEKFYADGITSGCGINPLRYCPESNLTEWELNVFMSRYGGSFSGSPTRANIAGAIQTTFSLP